MFNSIKEKNRNAQILTLISIAWMGMSAFAGFYGLGKTWGLIGHALGVFLPLATWGIAINLPQIALKWVILVAVPVVLSFTSFDSGANFLNFTGEVVSHLKPEAEKTDDIVAVKSSYDLLKAQREEGKIKLEQTIQKMKDDIVTLDTDGKIGNDNIVKQYREIDLPKLEEEYKAYKAATLTMLSEKNNEVTQAEKDLGSVAREVPNHIAAARLYLTSKDSEVKGIAFANLFGAILLAVGGPLLGFLAGVSSNKKQNNNGKVVEVIKEVPMSITESFHKLSKDEKTELRRNLMAEARGRRRPAVV